MQHAGEAQSVREGEAGEGGGRQGVNLKCTKVSHLSHCCYYHGSAAIHPNCDARRRGCQGGVMSLTDISPLLED